MADGDAPGAKVMKVKKRVGFMLTAFRDGLQSVFGARVFSQDFLPVVQAAAAAGIRHFESGGGALFQSPYFYTNEDSFAVMDAFRAAAGPEAELQTLARGIHVVALQAQPREVIRLHAQLFRRHGVTTIRNFDALNDVNNLVFSGRCIVEAGLKHEVTVTMMGLPPGCSGAHTAEFYVGVLRKILDAEIPYDSVCFKDASGTATPTTVHQTIKAARALLGDKVKLAFHSHQTAETCLLAYQAALEAGIDQLDLSLAPVSGGTCQPDLLTMWHALRGSEFDLGIDPHRIIELEELFKASMKDYFLPPEATRVEPLIPFFPMPGGALTANTQMLRDNGLMDRYPEVVAALGEAVAKGGFGTSVTPVSQFYFQQAFNNVLFGPWQRIAEGYGKMVLGYLGRTPVPPDPTVVRLASEQLQLPPASGDPLDRVDADPSRSLATARATLTAAGLPTTEENQFIVASCQDKGLLFLQGQGRVGVRKEVPQAAAAAAAAPAPVVTRIPTPAGATDPERYTVVVNGTSFDVRIGDQGQPEINGVPYSVQVSPASIDCAPAAPQAAPLAASTAGTSLHEVRSPLPGIVLRLLATPGQPISLNEGVLVLESMKMETRVHAPVAGLLAQLEVAPGTQVQAGSLLAVIRQPATGSGR